MPYRKEKFATGDICHLILRGIDDSVLFKDINDYYRGIFSIYEFNTSNPVEIRRRREARIKMKQLLKARGDPTSANSANLDMRDKLVEVLSFCLMPNHIHLLIRQIKDNGIIKFMAKMGGGYARYFNLKHSRKGYVFQNRFLAVPIKTDEQLRVVFAYIHANPISLIEPKWKENGINNSVESIKFVENYKWSSCSDYLGKPNFPSVTDRDFILETMGGERGCQEFIEDWIKYRGKIKESPDLFLE